MRLIKTTLLAASLAAASTAAPAIADGSMGKEAFGAMAREWLLENPEILMEALEVLETRRQSEQANSDLEFLRENAAAIYASPDDWAGGNLQGDITVVEFVDYRCGYCRRAAEQVEELVGSDGNIRIVMKEFPILGPDSLASSQFAIAARRIAGDEAYKKAHDALIALQGPASDAALKELAEELSLDWTRIQGEMAAPETARIIEANQTLANALQINGTPTFIIKETMVRGFVPLDGMRSIVEGQRKG